MKNKFLFFTIVFPFISTVFLLYFYLVSVDFVHAGLIVKSPAYLGLQNGLVGCWSFDGSYTNAPDCSGNNNTGTLTNGPTRAIGKIGQALSFDGVNDYVNNGTGTSLDMGAGNLTLAAWFKTTDTDGTIAVKGGSGLGGKRYLLNTDSVDCLSGRLKAEIDDDSTKKFVCSTVTVTNNAPHHGVLVRDGNILRLYVDGTQNATADITGYGNLNSTRIFSIGSIFNEGSGLRDTFISGLIDDVRVYNWALTQADVTLLRNYTESTSTIPPPVLANNPVGTNFRPTFVIYSPASGFTPATCTEAVLDYRAVGTYQGVARSFEIY